MACQNCKTIRDLLLHGKMAAAAGLTVETFRDKIGFKVVHEDQTVEGLRSTLVIDSDSNHRADATLPSLSSKTKAELLEIAANEGVEIEDGATNAEIIERIESKRQGHA